MAWFLAMRYNEKHGHWPLMKKKNAELSDFDDNNGIEKTGSFEMKSNATDAKKPNVFEVGTRSTSSSS